VNGNYDEAIKFHIKNDSMITMVSAVQHHKIPYGVLHHSYGGKVHAMKEKPEFSFNVNTGVYVMHKSVLDGFQNEFINMSDMINQLIAQKKPVYMYPVNTHDYQDFGNWHEYSVNAKEFKYIQGFT
jgi:NDP-sugar pyrophosphorylase family protein